jgi:hypothetical protein
VHGLETKLGTVHVETIATRVLAGEPTKLLETITVVEFASNSVARENNLRRANSELG